MTKAQEKYFEEYEKWKNVVIEPGPHILRGSGIRYDVVAVDIETESVSLLVEKSGNTLSKTLHWARKNLVPITR